MSYSVHVAFEKIDFIGIIGFSGHFRANGDERGINSGVGFLLNSKKAGTPGRIRTCDLRIRSPLLYPAELQAHGRQLEQNGCIAYVLLHVHTKSVFCFRLHHSVYKNRILTSIIHLHN